jgi:hypothetical protein
MFFVMASFFGARGGGRSGLRSDNEIFESIDSNYTVNENTKYYSSRLVNE